MSIFTEDFAEERAAIAHLKKQRSRLWIVYLAGYLIFTTVNGASDYIDQLLATLVLLGLGMTHFDVMQTRIEAREAALKQVADMAEIRRLLDRDCRS